MSHQHSGVSPDVVIVLCILVAFAGLLIGLMIGIAVGNVL